MDSNSFEANFHRQRPLAPIGTGRPLRRLSTSGDDGASAFSPSGRQPKTSPASFGSPTGGPREILDPGLTSPTHRRHTFSEPLARSGFHHWLEYRSSLRTEYDPFLRNGYDTSPRPCASPPMGISEQTLPARLDGSVPFDHLDDYLEYERREPMAATNNDDRERASLWARYGEESETSRVDVPRPDGTRRPNTIYQELNSYFSNRPEVARRESAKVQKNLQNPDKYQLTPQDRIDFVALVDARPKNYELIRRAVVVRKFLSEKAAGRLPMKYNIPGIDTDEYGGKVELDLSLAEKGILTSEALEILYGVGLHDLRSLQNASQDFGEVLEEYCMVQFILRQSDYEARITPLIEDLRKTTKEFAGSKGHSASAGRKRKRAIYALRDALREVF